MEIIRFEDGADKEEELLEAMVRLSTITTDSQGTMC